MRPYRSLHELGCMHLICPGLVEYSAIAAKLSTGVTEACAVSVTLATLLPRAVVIRGHLSTLRSIYRVLCELLARFFVCNHDQVQGNMLHHAHTGLHADRREAHSHVQVYYIKRNVTIA
jgi:hypothetical protein